MAKFIYPFVRPFHRPAMWVMRRTGLPIDFTLWFAMIGINIVSELLGLYTAHLFPLASLTMEMEEKRLRELALRAAHTGELRIRAFSSAMEAACRAAANAGCEVAFEGGWGAERRVAGFYSGDAGGFPSPSAACASTGTRATAHRGPGHTRGADGAGYRARALGDIAMLRRARCFLSMRTSRTMWPRIWKAAAA